MPRFYSFHDMPFARGIYCYAPCMATTRERKVPILGLEIEPSSVSACPALTPRPVPAEGARRRPPVCPRLGSACTQGGRQPRRPCRLALLHTPWLPGRPAAARRRLAAYCHTRGRQLPPSRTGISTLLCTAHLLCVGSTSGPQDIMVPGRSEKHLKQISRLDR